MLNVDKILYSVFILIFVFFVQCTKSGGTSSQDNGSFSLGFSCENGEGGRNACTSCYPSYGLLNGRCEPQASFVFELNSGTGTAPQVLKGVIGGSIVTPAQFDITREGFTFLGWSTLASPVGTGFYPANSLYPIPTDIRVATLTIYATWGSEYTITYNVNGGSGELTDTTTYPVPAGNPVVLQSPTGITKPSDASESPNGGFFGWGVDANGVGTTYRAGESRVFVGATTTLNALWYYPVTFDCNNGTGTPPEAMNLPMGYDLRTLPVRGCALESNFPPLVGWSVTGNLPLATTMPNSPLTLRAVYAVDRDSNGLIEISTAEQLNTIRYNLAGTSWKTSEADAGSAIGCPANVCHGYELVADIDLANTRWSNGYVGEDAVVNGWLPIGLCAVSEGCTAMPFVATLEGRGFTVSNLYINSSSLSRAGLFGFTVSSTSIAQLNLANVLISGENDVGGLVGYYDGGRIMNVHVVGSISGKSRVGGLVGTQNSGSIINSYSSAFVSGTGDFVGGLAGLQQANSHITGSFSISSVSGRDGIGGLVGEKSGTISNSYVSGSFFGRNYIGGLVGWQSNGGISNSYTTGGSASGNRYVGGLVGRQDSAEITNTYANISVSARGGGLGGLVGWQRGGTVTKSYARGPVGTGSADTVGGFIGVQAEAGTVANTYWDITSSGIGTSASATRGLTTLTVQTVAGGTASSLVSGLNNGFTCFKLTENRYPQLYSLLGGTCTTSPLFGPNVFNR